MGLDIGDRTVGVAVSDASGTIAQGLCVIRRTTPQRDLAAIVELVASRGVERIVAGLPRRLAGDLGPQAEKVLAFVGALQEAAPIPVELWDERLTTRIAERTLREANVARGRRRALVDQVAASVILQGFLDARAAERRRHEGPRPDPGTSGAEGGAGDADVSLRAPQPGAPDPDGSGGRPSECGVDGSRGTN